MSVLPTEPDIPLLTGASYCRQHRPPRAAQDQDRAASRLRETRCRFFPRWPIPFPPGLFHSVPGFSQLLLCVNGFSSSSPTVECRLGVGVERLRGARSKGKPSRSVSPSSPGLQREAAAAASRATLSPGLPKPWHAGWPSPWFSHTLLQQAIFKYVQ